MGGQPTLSPATKEERRARAAANRQRDIEETLERRTRKLLERRAAMTPKCAECGGMDAQLVTGAEVYGYRSDFAANLYWRCPCSAFVGVHKGTEKPLGYPAGPVTKTARRAAHAALDRLWQAKMTRDGVDQKTARGAAYKWLGQQMGLEPADMHIGMLNAAQANRVVEICTALRRPKTET